MSDILIIEDEKAVREALLTGLSQAFSDETVAGYGSVEEALEDIEVRLPKLIVSDVRLPGQSGLDLLLDAKRRWPVIQFILISAYATCKVKEQAIEFGAYLLLQKPFAIEELAQAARQALDAQLSSSVEGFSVVELMQIANLGKKTLAIYVQHGASRGDIFFRDGEVVHARTGLQEGISAFNEIVCWQRPFFKTKSGVNSPKTTVGDSFQHLLLEAYRLIDEANEKFESRRASPIPAEEVMTAEEAIEHLAGLQELTAVNGFLGACLVDSSGKVLAAERRDQIDLAVAATGNAVLVLAERKTIAGLELQDQIEDIVITLGTQYHLLRIVGLHQELFLYLILDRNEANLTLARHHLEELGNNLTRAVHTGHEQHVSPA